MLAMVLLLYSAGAAAQLAFHDPVTRQGVLDQVVSAFSSRAAAWQGVVMAAASWLFWTLGTISFTWTMGMLALKKADIGDFFTEFIRFTLFFGFFYWLLQNGPHFADSIIRSMRQIGDSAAGTTGLSPSGIVDVGFMIWKQAIRNLSLWSPIDSFVGMLLSAAILLLLAIVALNMLVLLISAWILMYAGIFFLGFGGARWTSDIAINYFKTVLGVAVQLFAMVLLVGIGNDMLSSFYGKMSKGALNFEELGVMLVFCLALLYLVVKIPPMLAGVISGGGGAGGIGNVGVGTVVGAAMGAATLAGAAMTAGAAGAAGGAQALMAAVSKASAAESAGGGIGDLMAAAGGGGGGGDDDAGGSGGGSALASAIGSDSGGIASVAAKVGRVAVGTATNLAQGSWDVAKAKAGSVRDGAIERIGETTGGKVASAIKAAGSQESTFGGDSLGAGQTDSDANDEVAAFATRDRDA